MPGMVESLAAINSAVRTFIALVVVGVLSLGGWYGYRKYNAADIEMREKDLELEQRQQRIEALEGDLKIVKERAEKLETSLRLMKVEHRLAYVDVRDQQTIDGKLLTTVEFTEVNDQDLPIAEPQEFRLRGKNVYVEGWVVKFEDNYVEAADDLRGTPLFAFKRIYGENQQPAEGFPLDKPGQRPVAYGTGREVSDFEQKIWDDFWSIVHDPEKRKTLGVRAAHGEAKFQEVRKGQRYRMMIRSAGDITFEPAGEAPAKPAPAL